VEKKTENRCPDAENPAVAGLRMGICRFSALFIPQGKCAQADTDQPGLGGPGGDHSETWGSAHRFDSSSLRWPLGRAVATGNRRIPLASARPQRGLRPASHQPRSRQTDLTGRPALQQSSFSSPASSSPPRRGAGQESASAACRGSCAETPARRGHQALGGSADARPGPGPTQRIELD
jgi:hypothetical protein